MDIKRIFRHIFTSHWQVKRAFPHAGLNSIEHAIQASEQAHTGEIRFVVEAALEGLPLYRGQTSRERAIEVFTQQRIWDTEGNSGLLIYLLMADRAVEIVADRGIHAKVREDEWLKICHQMEDAFKQANYVGGVVGGIDAVTQHLLMHFPAQAQHVNELSDTPVLL